MTVVEFCAGLRRRRVGRRWTRGFTIFSVLLAFAMGGLVIVGVVGMYNSAVEDKKRADSVMLLNELRAAVEKTFVGNPTYGSSNNNLVPVLAARGGIPDRALKAGNAGWADDGIIHSFGGAVDIVGNPGGTAPTQFYIKFNGVESEVCQALGNVFIGRSRARAGIVKVKAVGGEMKTPISHAALNSLCGSGAAAVNVEFHFG